MPTTDERYYSHPQPCDGITAMDSREELDALEALGLHIDRELRSLAIMQEDEPTMRKVSSAPDLRGLDVTVSEIEASGVCAVDDLSHPLAASAVEPKKPRKSGFADSKEWLDTFL